MRYCPVSYKAVPDLTFEERSRWLIRMLIMSLLIMMIWRGRSTALEEPHMTAFNDMFLAVGL